MYSHVTLGTNDTALAVAFYGPVLAVLGLGNDLRSLFPRFPGERSAPAPKARAFLCSGGGRRGSGERRVRARHRPPDRVHAIVLDTKGPEPIPSRNHLVAKTARYCLFRVAAAYRVQHGRIETAIAFKTP
jgi:hypothetical protein